MFKSPYIGLIFAVIIKLVVYVTTRKLLEREISETLKSYSEFGILFDPQEKE